MRKSILLSCLACVFATVASVSSGVQVKLTVKETAQSARSPGLVTMGVPFARGAVKDVSKLTVAVGGKALPAQFAKLAPWDDGSVRWALMDVQAEVPAGGTIELTVSDAGGNPAPPAPAKIEDKVDAVNGSAGPLQFVINKKKSPLFESLKVDGKELITSAGRGLVLITEDNKEVVAGPPTEVKIEQAGPMRAVVCLRGKFPGVHNDLLAYTVRVSAFAGQKLVKVHAWLENQGGMGYFSPNKGDNGTEGKSEHCEWFKFSGMNVELGLGLGDNPAARCESAKAGGAADFDFKVYQTCKLSKAQPGKADPPGPWYTWNDFEYTITGDGKELAKGDRTDGVVTLTGANGSLVTAVRDFWQNYDKAIELNGDKLKLWLWPTDGRWPRPQTHYTRRPTFYDKNLDAMQFEGRYYYLQGGVNKGHELALDFNSSGRDAKAVQAELSEPLAALASADYYASTEAAVGIFAPPQTHTGNKGCDAKLDAWMRMTRTTVDPDSPTGLIQASHELGVKRAADFAPEMLFWFGWMDYGDIPVPGHGPVSLEFDWTWIMLLNAMRTGDAGFMELGSSMARHRIDIDQLWSDRDPPEGRGLQRGLDNMPNMHCNRLSLMPGLGANWLAGVVQYYMLTGEPKALECCQRNAAGIEAAWTTGRKIPRYNMAANGWAISSYLAMYDLTADKKWLDEALGLFRTNVTAEWKEDGPFLHDPDHQIQGQGYVKADQAYCFAITALCDLHRHTGDAEVLKLLTEGCQKEFPGTFYAAPKFLADLYAYVGYKTANADYLAKAAELFDEGSPESKNPLLVMPGSSTWCEMAATTLRSGHILQYANWKLAGKK